MYKTIPLIAGQFHKCRFILVYNFKPGLILLIKKIIKAKEGEKKRFPQVSLALILPFHQRHLHWRITGKDKNQNKQKLVIF